MLCETGSVSSSPALRSNTPVAVDSKLIGGEEGDGLVKLGTAFFCGVRVGCLDVGH